MKTISIMLAFLVGLIPRAFAIYETTIIPTIKIVVGDTNDFPKCLGFVTDGCYQLSRKFDSIYPKTTSTRTGTRGRRS
jgi:hypothetical protein